MARKPDFDARYHTLLGKNLVGAVTKEDLDEFLPLVAKILDALDEADLEDAFGTEGWRHSILGED